MLALEMAAVIELHLRSLAAYKDQVAWVSQAESRLNNQLQGVFRNAFDGVLRELKKAGRIPSNDMTRAKLVDHFFKLEDDVADFFFTEASNAARYGSQAVVNDLVARGQPVKITEPSQRVTRALYDHSFQASQRTIERASGFIMSDLAEAYNEGKGIDEAMQDIARFSKGFLDHELERICRTEINSAQSLVAFNTMSELGVEYHQWWSGGDDRVRDEDDVSHVDMHGQIVRVGEKFSNGLMHPGDRDMGEATIREWINCRCRAVPFIMPEGWMAPPGKSHFYEIDLVMAPEDVKPEESQAKLAQDLKDTCDLDYAMCRKHMSDDEIRAMVAAFDDAAVANKGMIDEVRKKYDPHNLFRKIDEDPNFRRKWRKVLEDFDRAFLPDELETKNKMFSAWVGSSTNPKALRMMIELDRLGLSKADTALNYAKETGYTREQTLKWVMEQTDRLKSPEKAVLKQYAKNQAILKKLGWHEVDLYRGMNLRGSASATSVDLGQRATASWSTNQKVAVDFASGRDEGVVFARKIRAKDIFSSVLTETMMQGTFMNEAEWLPLAQEAVRVVQRIPAWNIGGIPAWKRDLPIQRELIWEDWEFDEYIREINQQSDYRRDPDDDDAVQMHPLS